MFFCTQEKAILTKKSTKIYFINFSILLFKDDVARSRNVDAFLENELSTLSVVQSTLERIQNRLEK